jgi:hypothetical protein
MLKVRRLMNNIPESEQAIIDESSKFSPERGRLNRRDEPVDQKDDIEFVKLGMKPEFEI